ncbi:NfeD family protein [Hoeflea prorocentri]|uniref:NfeD family protein n=1 Tax=Hoeflea prorocentri TaxID=1922333 RepID=A0A9X3UE70_9HYPH|nr:NfeD family protein [Hoeflea prorocentri]MCY6379252.1 NfeD family protein [Hoeflea prorocentri]MDA5397053.1 NfeD family protein [Hoeflea prorocentri]
MIERIIQELGPWSWMVLGLVLLAAEILMPGVFLIWIGIAAIIVGAISLVFWSEPFWAWQLQILVFAILAVAAAVVGRRMMKRSDESDEPLLNKRGESLVGRTATLSEPINEGRGRIRIDDTTWVVSGPDLPVGTRVKVVESTGRELRVDPV